MKRNLTIVVILVLIVVIAAVAVVRQRRGDVYKLAKELPNGALFYVQIADLPALIARWKDSDLRQRYLASGNFFELQKRHLALKLADRAADIESALGFFPDLDFAAGLGEKDAALAVYDIGRMEFVFVASVSAEKALATSLMARAESFESLSANGVDFYAREIEVDRGRQRQKVMFAVFRGRLVFATSEREFFRTIDILRGRGTATIADEPSFRELSAKLEPHLVTVWTDQRKLNEDWYFRHYFNHPDDPRVKSVRAALFDLSESENSVTEHRVFLSEPNASTNAEISAATAARLACRIPADASLATISSADEGLAASKIFAAAFDAPDAREIEGPERATFRFYEWDEGLWNSDAGVSDAAEREEDDVPAPEMPTHEDSIASAIAVAGPIAVAEIFRPKSLPAPLLIDDQRAVVVSFAKPAAFDRTEFERALAAAAVNRTTAGVAGFAWNDLKDEKFEARELRLRGLGWSVVYAFRGRELFVSGNRELLTAMMTTEGIAAPSAAVIKFARFVPDAAREPFTDMFIALGRGTDGYGNRFFLNTAGSLFDVAKGLRSVSFTERGSGNLIFETIDYDY